MSLQIDRRLKKHIGNGTATEFDYDFIVLDADDLLVYHYDTVTLERTLLDSSDYSVTGIGDEDGGVVTYDPGTPIPTTEWIIIVREVPYTQELDINNQSGFYPTAVETQLDRMVMQVQQLAEQQSRFPRLIEGEAFTVPMPHKAALANATLAFDADGEPIVGPTTTDLANAAEYAEDAADALAAVLAAIAGSPQGLAGGTTGQTAVKASNTDFDLEWADLPDIGVAGRTHHFSQFRKNYASDQLAFEAMIADAWASDFSGGYEVTIDLDGAQLLLSQPINIATLTGSTGRQVPLRIRNGSLRAEAGAGWVATSSVTRAANGARVVGAVTAVMASIGQVAVGQLVTGAGVPRETYVLAIDVPTLTITVSNTFYTASSGNLTFHTFNFMLNFSGLTTLTSKVWLEDLIVECQGLTNFLKLPASGINWKLSRCWLNAPERYMVVDWNAGGSGMGIEDCIIYSNENSATDPAGWTSIGLSFADADVKIKGNLIVNFLHGVVLSGAGQMIIGNHIWQGGTNAFTSRNAAIAIQQPSSKSMITGNYIDNGFIEISNYQNVGGTGKLGGCVIVGNIFTAHSVAASFSWIVLNTNKASSPIDNLLVMGNVFKVAAGTNVTDPSGVILGGSGSLSSTVTNLRWVDNVYDSSITRHVASRVTRKKTFATAVASMSMNFADTMPFGLTIKEVVNVAMRNQLTAADAVLTTFPHVNYTGNAITLTPSVNAKGVAVVTVDCSDMATVG